LTNLEYLAKLLDIVAQVLYNSEMLYATATLKKGKFMRFNPKSKTYKVFSALQTGQTLTAAEAKKRFGVGNLSAEASRIRANGFAVYADQRVAGNGVRVTEYRLGTPSRKVIAAGYRALAMGIA